MTLRPARDKGKSGSRPTLLLGPLSRKCPTCEAAVGVRCTKKLRPWEPRSPCPARKKA